MEIILKLLPDAYSATFLDSSNVNYVINESELYLKLSRVEDAIASLRKGINN
ncbi:MAG: hypothetical protein R2836_09995 [Chitinophagales bacterium]